MQKVFPKGKTFQIWIARTEWEAYGVLAFMLGERSVEFRAHCLSVVLNSDYRPINADLHVIYLCQTKIMRYSETSLS